MKPLYKELIKYYVLHIFLLLLMILSTCSIQKDSMNSCPTYKPGTYYNQHRPKYSPFEMYRIPTIENDRGSQYRKKMKHKID